VILSVAYLEIIQGGMGANPGGLPGQ